MKSCTSHHLLAGLRSIAAEFKEILVMPALQGPHHKTVTATTLELLHALVYRATKLGCVLRRNTHFPSRASQLGSCSLPRCCFSPPTHLHPFKPNSSNSILCAGPEQAVLALRQNARSMLVLPLTACVPLWHLRLPADCKVPCLPIYLCMASGIASNGERAALSAPHRAPAVGKFPTRRCMAVD